MKKTISFAVCFVSTTALFAQNWQTAGNSGTIPATNFVGTTDNQKLVFRTDNAPRLIIGSNNGASGGGCVGIGDVDPDNGLTGGTLRVRGAGTSTAIDLIRATNNPSSAWDNQIRFYSPTGLRHLITDDYGSGKLILYANYDANAGGTNIVDIRGRVQIGSGTANTPAGYSLYCEGGILAEKLKVAVKNSFDWADYVFEPGYKLMPLDSIFRFTQRHKHLPGVPSAAEVVKQGVDVGQMQSTLLGKIEELYLYTIALSQEVKALKKENLSIKRTMRSSRKRK
jgi:trimeric autotransporter adhesin